MTDESFLRTLIHMTPLEHRFWSKVRIVDDDASCWEWIGARHPNGYGHFQFTPPGETTNRAVVASRVSLLFTNGAMPVVACHHCDNPPCVRPSHLYDGTHAENAADKFRRGRGGTRDQRGEKNSSSVLTEEIVTGARIAMRDDPGMRIEMVATNYGVSSSALYQAVVGRSWTHLDTPPLEIGQRGRGKLSPENIQRLRTLLSEGKYSRDELAAMFGIDPSAVSYHRRAMKLPDRRTKAGRRH